MEMTESTGQSTEHKAPGTDWTPGRNRFQKWFGALMSLLSLFVALWAASKGLQSILMTVVWIKQLAGGGGGLDSADLFRGTADSIDGGALPAQTLHPGDYAIQALTALLLAALGALAAWGVMRLRRRALGRAIDTSLTRFISSRYLLSREHKTLVSLITVISVLGIAVGVTALIVVISVIEGFDKVLLERTMGVFSHIEVWPMYSDETLTDSDKIVEKILQIPGVEAASPIINQQTFFQTAAGTDAFRTGGILRGLDPKVEPKVTTLTNNIVKGTGIPQEGEIILGSELAKRLRAQPGNFIYLVGKVVGTASGPRFKLSRVKVAGIFNSGLYDIDVGIAYATLETVQRLFVMDNGVSAVHARISDPYKSFDVQSQLIDILGPERRVRTWQQINPQFFAALRMEKMTMFVILLLIVVVAAFNIIGTLIMVVTQKTREIGILKSMGASNGDILLVFLYHGLIIGVVGTGLGLSLGLRLCWFVDKHIDKIYQLPGNVYYGLDRLPVQVDPPTIAAILASSLIICIAAAVIPAVQASRLNPVEALRYE